MVATGKHANSFAFQWVADETFDVGVDTRGGVNDNDYVSPFPFKGTINKLTFKMGPSQLSEADHESIRKAVATSNN